MQALRRAFPPLTALPPLTTAPPSPLSPLPHRLQELLVKEAARMADVFARDRVKRAGETPVQKTLKAPTAF
jgi:hypothetical protein